MRYDEAFTFLEFVNGSFWELFAYPVPNNHVLHTLLVRGAVELFGNDPVAIRLPAFAAGVLAIPLTFVLARRLTRGPTAGWIAAGAAAVFPYLVLYDTVARGYSMVTVLTLTLSIVGLGYVEHPSRARLLILSALVSLGLLTVPTFLFAAAGISAWVLTLLSLAGCPPRWLVRSFLLPYAAIATAMTTLLYTPVLIVNGGIASIVGNQFVQGLPWPEFLHELPRHAQATVTQILRDVPSTLTVIALVLCVIGWIGAIRRRHWPLVTLIPSIAITAAVVLMVRHAIPYPRSWLYFLPLLFVMVDAGLTTLVPAAQRIIRCSALAGAAIVAASLMSANTIAHYPDIGHFPEAPTIAEVLASEMSVDDTLRVRVPANYPLRFAMWARGVPHRPPPANRKTGHQVFYVVKPSRYPLRESAPPHTRRLLAIGDAELWVADTRPSTPGPVPNPDQTTVRVPPGGGQASAPRQ